MIRKAHRFHGHGSLRYVYNNGQIVRGPMCSLKYVRNERRDSYRLAVVVSKKVHKSAVVRNRIRRRLYEAFRLEEPNMVAPHDVVVTVFTDTVASVPAEQITRLVHAQLKQAGITNK